LIPEEIGFLHSRLDKNPSGSDEQRLGKSLWLLFYATDRMNKYVVYEYRQAPGQTGHKSDLAVSKNNPASTNWKRVSLFTFLTGF